MPTPDNNYISFNGPHHNGITYAASEDFDASKLDDAGRTYADAVKCSTGLTDFTGIFKKVTSGTEDALDVNNRCRNLKLYAEMWEFRGTFGITIKGESHGVHVHGYCKGHGKSADVGLGNWSDQARKGKTTEVVLDLQPEPGEVVTIQVLNADKPLLAPGSGPYRYVFPHPDSWYHPIVVQCFIALRRGLGIFG
jgi:hypothetical protein